MGLTWYQKALLHVLDAGEIPRHVAIIMDGNRRFARKHKLSSVSLGHKEGSEKLRQVIEWFAELDGIEELSVYAFSILNFNRAKDEVNGLMDLAENTFREIADQPDFFKKYCCKINFIGRIEMLEERVLKQIERINKAAHPNPKFILNICACYTSHDEIEHSRDACFEKGIEPTYEHVFENLELPHKVDLMIRTSGVFRLSNYMLLQCKDAPIIVTDKLWPELSVFDVFVIFLKYQLRNVLPE